MNSIYSDDSRNDQKRNIVLKILDEWILEYEKSNKEMLEQNMGDKNDR